MRAGRSGPEDERNVERTVPKHAGHYHGGPRTDRAAVVYTHEPRGLSKKYFRQNPRGRKTPGVFHLAESEAGEAAGKPRMREPSPLFDKGIGERRRPLRLASGRRANARRRMVQFLQGSSSPWSSG